MSQKSLYKLQDSETERWSRTIGALGSENWERLTSMRYAIIGAGRTGSQIAMSLTRIGASRITLVDPDTIEYHNLGEMYEVTEADIGRPKVEALSERLSQKSDNIIPVPYSITSFCSLYAVKQCDFIFSCVDHDSARLASTALATLFCKPMIDIASGIHGNGRNRQMGADIRLLLPGQCLLCFGGLRDRASALWVLSSPDNEQSFYASRDWRKERTGSLASLNGCAVNIAMRMLEDLVSEMLQESTWAHLEFGINGHLDVSYHSPRTETNRCSLCELMGMGDMGLPKLRELLQSDTE